MPITNPGSPDFEGMMRALAAKIVENPEAVAEMLASQGASLQQIQSLGQPGAGGVGALTGGAGGDTLAPPPQVMVPQVAPPQAAPAAPEAGPDLQSLPQAASAVQAPPAPPPAPPIPGGTAPLPRGGGTINPAVLEQLKALLGAQPLQPQVGSSLGSLIGQ